MPASRATVCKGCWNRLHMPIPIRGPASLPMKLFGIRVSRMNPNLCTLCETMFQLLMKTKRLQITATILFADVRGYTRLSEVLDQTQMAEMLGQFYDVCSTPIWDRDGIVNKLIGDAVFAIFNFPIARDDHARMAVMSAIEMQARCLELKGESAATRPASPDLGIGIGVHTGRVTIGEIGQFCKDFTAIGEVVNVAARLQSVAQPGEVLMSGEVYEQVRDEIPVTVERTYTLKGVSEPVHAFSLSGPVLSEVARLLQ
jgi:adenylate cyclase